jgi:putative restriction endonuclease
VTAYWLTFKPLGPNAPQGWPIDEMRKLVRTFETDPAKATVWWRIASHRAAKIGDRVYLFKQGNDPRGIFGVGSIIDGPELRESPTDREGVRHRALVRFERLVDPTRDFLLPLEGNRDIILQSLIDAAASGNSVPETVFVELERRLASMLPTVNPLLESDQADDASFDPDSSSDEGERALRAIRIRRGQPKFRAALLEAYESCCAVTGCAVLDVLEAAHIAPYMGSHTNHVTNGLLLRADIHTLFDCGLLSIHPHTRRVVVAKSLEASSYGKLSERPLRRPKNPLETPSKKCLEKHFETFSELEKQRNA